MRIKQPLGSVGRCPENVNRHWRLCQTQLWCYHCMLMVFRDWRAEASSCRPESKAAQMIRRNSLDGARSDRSGLPIGTANLRQGTNVLQMRLGRQCSLETRSKRTGDRNSHQEAWFPAALIRLASATTHATATIMAEVTVTIAHSNCTTVIAGRCIDLEVGELSTSGEYFTLGSVV